MEEEPECNIGGVCTASLCNKEDVIANCKYCGGEMFKEDGFWYRWSQEEIPVYHRGTIHDYEI